MPKSLAALNEFSPFARRARHWLTPVFGPVPRAHGSLLPDFAEPAKIVAGSEIDTPGGLVPAEDLCPGDLVLTQSGAQPIVAVDRSFSDGTGPFAPVVLGSGVAGTTRDITLSPEQTVLVSGWQAQLLRRQEEALVSAVELINDHTVQRAPRSIVRYVHLAVARPAMLSVSGMMCVAGPAGGILRLA